MDMFMEDMMPKFAVGDRVYSIDYVWDSEEIPCDQCNGRGSIDDKECASCDGEGHIYRLLDTYSWRVDSEPFTVGKVKPNGNRFFYEFCLEPLLDEDIEMFGEEFFMEVPEDELFTTLEEASREALERNRSGVRPSDWRAENE